MNLKDYLYQVHLLEMSIYEQDMLIQRIEQRISGLDSLTPRKHETMNPPLPSMMTAIGASLLYALFAFVIGSFVGWLMGSIIKYIIWGLAGVFIFVTLYYAEKDDERAYSDERIRVKLENREVDKHNALVQTVPARLEILYNQLNYADAVLAETRQSLQQLYALNVIYPKYRNMVAVASLYEYIDSGRCKDLTGYEGAYNIYEQELRLGIIIGKLDQIIYRLDQIQANQHLLATALQESNRKAEQICQEIWACEDKLEQIQSNVKVNGWFNVYTALNTASIARYCRQSL